MAEYVLKVDGKEFPLPAQSQDYCNTIHEVGKTGDSVFENHGSNMRFEMNGVGIDGQPNSKKH